MIVFLCAVTITEKVLFDGKGAGTDLVLDTAAKDVQREFFYLQFLETSCHSWLNGQWWSYQLAVPVLV